MLVAAAEGACEGDWLIADRQRSGRGRMGREWQSPVGNLHASGLVRLSAGDPPAPTLALVAAVAVHDAASSWVKSERLRLKWPNDLLADGAKLAGVLLERAGDAVVIGVGVNLRHHPVGMDRSVTSIAALGAVPPSAHEFTKVLQKAVAHRLEQWRSGLCVIRTDWLDRAHAVGTALTARLPDGEQVEGVFEGLSKDFALRMRLADGSTRVIHAADVFLI